MNMDKFVASLNVFEREELMRALKPAEGEEHEIALWKQGKQVDAMKLRRYRTLDSLKDCRDFFLKLQG